MKKVISTERLPIKLWLDDLEDGALEQAKNLANLPFAYKHIPLMPDSHQGYGMPIGSILATKNVIVPNAVGVDIGCGMCALRTTLTDLTSEDIKQVFKLARTLIPLGKERQLKNQDNSALPEITEKNTPIVFSQYKKSLKQLGTLGGGNHFIELQKGDDGFIWIMIHSGSRNLGYTVAKHYNNIATRLNGLYHSSVTVRQELAFLPINTPEAKLYFNEMNYCVKFALENRKLMLQRMIDSLHAIKGEFEYGSIINESHNFAAWENHFGKNVIVHRKGATKAEKGDIGMIPGSQGTSSYIVKGLGNVESFKSCSHGAGRKMGRKQAIRELDFDKEINNLNAQGIVHSIQRKEDLDEAPSSYKDIDVVMENQKDLVSILVKLTPLGVLKG